MYKLCNVLYLYLDLFKNTSVMFNIGVSSEHQRAENIDSWQPSPVILPGNIPVGHYASFCFLFD
jgi:hypothetical protein